MFNLNKRKALGVDVLKTNNSRKHKFVADGVFYAELNELLQRELDEDGYSGVEIRRNGLKFQIIVRLRNALGVLWNKGRRLHELKSLIVCRFGFPKDRIELYVDKIVVRGLCSASLAESIKIRIMCGLPIRRSVESTVRFIMESGAQGCEITISGKLRGQRAQGMTFKDGYMIKSGNATRQFHSTAVRCISLRMGIIGIKVTIMLDSDPSGKYGPIARIPDVVEIKTPKEETSVVKTEVIPANKQDVTL